MGWEQVGGVYWTREAGTLVPELVVLGGPDWVVHGERVERACGCCEGRLAESLVGQPPLYP